MAKRIRRELTRVVGHFDLDYFFAQVEEVHDPSSRKLPVVVCVYSGRTEDSGVVSTANYKAREFGVKSGMPISVAKRRLMETEARFLPMRRELYEAPSERIMSLLRAETDALEQTGIDEAFFDITAKTGGDFGAATVLASSIKRQVLQREKLTCSIGIGPNKIVAKLASDFAKPDGLTLVPPEEVNDFMNPLPVDKLYGIGSKSSTLLRERGITTIADLAGADPQLLEGVFGHKLAAHFHNAARGVDEEPVTPRTEATQLSRIITLKKDTQDVGEILAQLNPAIEDLHNRLMEKKLAFRSVSVIGILPNLSIRTRTKSLEIPTVQLSPLTDTAPALLSSLTSETGVLRRVGIRVSGLETAEEQSSLADFLR